MADRQDNFYTAMVMTVSNYDDIRRGGSRRVVKPSNHAGSPPLLPSSGANSNCSMASSYHSPGGRPPTTQPVPVAFSPSNPSARGDAAPASNRYMHNPYAATCTTASEPSVYASRSISTTAESFQSFQATYSPMVPPDHSAYACDPAPEDTGASSLTERFLNTAGYIAITACSARGRHLLVSVLRLQHMDKIELIFEEILPQVNMVVMDQHGCHVVRTLIEFITTEQMSAMVPYFHSKTILQMATTSQPTRRVLQSIFERHQTDALTPIVEVLASDCRRLAMNQQGCIGIMRIIECALPDQKQLLISKLIPVLPSLTMDPYGNYVVQCILQNMEGCTTIAVVCAAFNDHWVPLSCNKFASNVMEKVVWQMDGLARHRLVRELVFEPSNLHRLVQDGFGNFVLQAIIESSKDVREFCRVLDVVSAQLSSSPYGHKIETKLRGKHSAFFGTPELPLPLMER